MIGSFLEQGDHTIKRETQSSLKHKAGRAPLWGLHFSTRLVLIVLGATDKSPALLPMATGFPAADCRQRIRGGIVSKSWLNTHFVLNVNLGVFLFAFPLPNYQVG